MTFLEPVEDAAPVLQPPEPVPGCMDCQNLATRRTYARTQGDESALTDVRVLLRAHLRVAH